MRAGAGFEVAMLATLPGAALAFAVSFPGSDGFEATDWVGCDAGDGEAFAASQQSAITKKNARAGAQAVGRKDRCKGMAKGKCGWGMREIGDKDLSLCLRGEAAQAFSAYVLTRHEAGHFEAAESRIGAVYGFAERGTVGNHAEHAPAG